MVAFRLGSPVGSPQAMIAAPKDGELLPAGDVNVSVDVMHFNLTNKLGQANVTGEGHILYYMDVTAPTIKGKPATTASGTYVPTAEKSHTWKNVKPGMHNFSIELVNNDNTPLSPPVTDKVTVMVQSPAPKPTKNVTIDLSAKNIAFNMSNITVPAGAAVTVNFDNQDQGVAHNLAVYDTPAAATTIFKGDIIVGPRKIVYTFVAPTKPGTYFFRCDVHPMTMTGKFIVK